jgi:predicted acetyltransferase
MLRRLLLEAHARELPVSALYAANHPLYRSVGYEAAGSRTLAAIAPDRIGVVERAGTIHALEAQDEALRRTLYRRVAQRQPGHLDREAGLWRRATHDRDDEPHPSWVAVSAAGSPEGYVTLERRGGAGIAQQLGALDLVATTPWALRRLLCFLSDFSSVVAEVQFPTGPGDPVGLVLHEPRLRVVEHQVWLLRVVSIAPALAARGWHPTATGRVDLEVEDDLLPGNAGRWVLEVAGGQARVGRGGAGSVRLGPRGLAALYSGYLRPEAAVAAGLLEGPDEQLAVLGGLCAGPSPWMMEMF